MTNPTLPTSAAYFCAACGAADVTFQELTNTASCNVCGWSGRQQDLAMMPFQHDLGTPQEVAQAFFLDLRKVLAQTLAPEMCRFLVKWGFLMDPTTVPPDQGKKIAKRLARYMGAITQALCKTIMSVRADIEKEEHGSQRPTN